MLTNLVLLATSLLTNSQSAITGHTNGAAIVTHVEAIQRTEITGWAKGKKIISKQTNSYILPQRRWQELLADVSSAPAMPQSAVQRTNPPQVKAPPIGPDTNSPAFKRRLEREAERNARINAVRTNQPSVK